jgi:hypothetical protein
LVLHLAQQRQFLAEGTLLVECLLSMNLAKQEQRL